MSFRSYRAPFTNIADGTDIKEGHPRTIAAEYIRRIALRNNNAVKVDRVRLYFYQKLQSGRRCSCWDTEVSPEGFCPVCFNSGFAIGYNKWGCQSHLMDWTHPYMVAVGVVPNFLAGSDTRPVMFTLPDGVSYGYLQMTERVLPNRRVVDALRIVDSVGDPRNSVTVLIRSPSDHTWVPFSRESLVMRLSEESVTVRAELRRGNANISPPTLCSVFYRYRVRDEIEVIADKPRLEESITLAEFGITDAWSTTTYWFDDTLKKITTNDFFRDIEEGTDWKAVTSNPNKPHGRVTSHDITCRLGQKDTDPYSLVP